MDNIGVVHGENSDRTIPWILILYLAVIFFLTNHDVVSSVGTHQTEELIIAEIEKGHTIRRIALLSLGLFSIIGLLRYRKGSLGLHGALGWLIAFFLFWTALSIFWTDNIMQTSRKLGVLTILCLGALFVTNRVSIRQLMVLIFVITGLYVVVGISAEIVLGTFQPLAEMYRFGGTVHPNLQGVNCALFLISGMAIAVSEKRQSWLFLLGALVGLCFLVLTKSRASFASGMIGIAVCSILVSSHPWRVALIMGALWVFCFVILIFGDSLLPTIWHGFLLGREERGTLTLTNRIPLWVNCLTYVNRRPLLGYGYGSFWTSRRVLGVSSSEGWGVGTAHSDYLEVALGLGYVGLAVFVLIYILVLQRVYSLFKTSDNSYYAGVFSMLIMLGIDSFIESVNTNAGFTNFVFIVLVGRAAFWKDLTSRFELSRVIGKRKVIFNSKNSLLRVEDWDSAIE